MKKVLIIYSHPNPKSFSHAILESVLTKLKEHGKEVVVRDLYMMKFNPILSATDFMAFQEGRTPEDIQEEQKHIQWCDTMIFIFPLWWGGLPAITKGYVDRVFSHGFAFVDTPEGPKGLLTDKKVLIFEPQGESKESYEKEMWPAMNHTVDQNIFGFCGIKVIRHIYFPSVPAVTLEVRKGYLRQTEQTIEECK